MRLNKVITRCSTIIHSINLLINLIPQAASFLNTSKTRLHSVALRSKHEKIKPWIGIADINPSSSSRSDDNVIIETFTDHFELSSPRAWLEYNEIANGNSGAYTVLRCDFSKHEQDLSNVAKVWGQEFHLNRLRHSFTQMVTSNQIKCGIEAFFDQDQLENELNVALRRTKTILQELIQKAIVSCSESEEYLNESANSGDKEIKIGMVTLLWTEVSFPDNKELKIRIQGHFFSSNTFINPKQTSNCNPISASVALPMGRNTLPSRYDNVPEAKMSSWCRIRKPIEDIYKDQQISEVLLVREAVMQNKNEKLPDLILLEGLTSNLFIVYEDGSIHTSDVETKDNDGGVLGGFARHLVMKAAELFDIPIVLGPIILEDGENGLWKEAFTTSSIKLITPVSKILLPVITDKMYPDGKDERINFEAFWSETPLEDLTWEKRRWQILYEILQSTSAMTTYS